MAYAPICNFVNERRVRQKFEFSHYQRIQDLVDEGTIPPPSRDFIHVFHGTRSTKDEDEKLKQYHMLKSKIYQEYELQNLTKKEPFQFYRKLPLDEIPEFWLPAQGIIQLPLLYHQGRVIETTEDMTEEGYKLHPILKHLLYNKYPSYLKAIKDYCRPLGTTKATFSDFNRDQKSSAPIDPERNARVMKLVHHFMDVTPYAPLHFVDTQYTKMPLNRGTGYHNRHLFKIKAQTTFSRPEEYATRTTSKGYFINATLSMARNMVHLVKFTGLPFPLPENADDLLDTELTTEITRKLSEYFDKYPTLLFTRNHISLRGGNLKQPPVYAVDDIFIIIESMLTFPAQIQARKMTNCIMYGLETLRGSNRYLDKIAQRYLSYFTIDWSAFDQTVPHVITGLFFGEFLPSILIVNKGYQPTFEYPDTRDVSTDEMYARLNNLILFLHTWFHNMTFVSLQGYAYRRTAAGIPSSLLNTQYLDSFCNVYILIDALIEFGATDDEILEICLFIMGNDNSGFTYWSVHRLWEFVKFLEKYAKTRWNMKLSATKCIITEDRRKIETLAYKCNLGYPIRDITKLIAQLCYPERGYIDKYMSMRAIGIAYASCGMDLQFYNLCKDVYYSFLPYAAPLDDDNIDKLMPYMPGQFSTHDEIPDFLKRIEFPTFRQIQQQVEYWHGPLPFHPKWDLSHFCHLPDHKHTNYVTLQDYRKKKGYIYPGAPQLPTNPVE